MSPEEINKTVAELDARAIKAMDQLVELVEKGIPCYGSNGRPLLLPDGTQQRRPAPSSYYSSLNRWLKVRESVVAALYPEVPAPSSLSPTAAALAEMVKQPSRQRDMADHARKSGILGTFDQTREDRAG